MVSTSNYLYRQGTAPNTRAAVSQKNKVYSYAVGAAKFQQMGVISEFGIDESRTIDPVRGVGFGDIIAELVPSVTEPATLTMNKTLLYLANLFQMVGYKGGVDGLVRSLRHHRWPFDVKQELVFSELAGTAQGGDGYSNSQFAASTKPPAGDFAVPVSALFTFFEGCWFNNYGTSYTSDAAMVAENSSATVTDVISGTDEYGEYIDSGLAPTQNNGSAGKGYSLRFAQSSAVATAGGLI